MSVIENPFDASEYPLDLGGGIRVAKGADALWILFPEPVGPIRVPLTGSPAWRVITESPLTLDPSIKVWKAREPNPPSVHGFVRDGRWVSCGDGQYH